MPEFGGEMAESKTDVMIRADNKETDQGGYYVLWDSDKFDSRIQMMREHLNTFFDTEVVPDFKDKDHDPWWDPIEPLQIGTSYLGLKNLTFGMGSDMDCKILSSEGKGGVRGQLKVNYDVMMKDGSGWKIDEDGDQFADVEEPKDMAGKAINFEVGVGEANGLPEDLCTNIFCTYTMKHEPNNTHATNECPGYASGHDFKHKKMHGVDTITDYHIEYFEKGQIAFKVFGYPFYKGRFDKSIKMEKNAINDPRLNAAQKEAAIEVA